MAATSPSCMVVYRHPEAWCRAERLYQMKCMFVAGGAYTTEELAERFGVTVITIRKDLRVLSGRLGVPLVCIVETRWRMMSQEDG